MTKQANISGKLFICKFQYLSYCETATPLGILVVPENSFLLGLENTDDTDDSAVYTLISLKCLQKIQVNCKAVGFYFLEVAKLSAE